MENIYKEILQLALSSAEETKRADKLIQLWKLIDEDKLFRYAVIDEVSSHVGFLLKKTTLVYSEKWEKEFERIDKYISVLMDTLEDVATELKKDSIKIVALKNAGIAKAIYKNNACSPMGDIDLLVGSKDFRKAHEILLKMGFVFKFRSKFENEDIEEAFRGGGTEYFKIIKGYKIWLELQWRPIAGRWIQPHNEPNGDELMSRSIEVINSNIRILSPVDNLLQVALHTAKHSYVRAPGFRLHSDVDRIVRFQKINWDEFVEKVLALELKTAVFFSLYYSKKLLDTPIPDFVFNRLKPNKIRSKIIKYYIKKASIFNQKSKKFSKVGYIIFNLALYDNIKENRRAIFPSYDSIKIKYPIKNRFQLPYFYMLRFSDLLFKRAKL